MSYIRNVKQFLIEVNKFPIGRKIAICILLIFGLIVGLASIAFCVLAVWGLLLSVLDGTLTPNIDPNETEWNIR